MSSDRLAVGVDIGGTNIKIGLISRGGQVIDFQSLLLKRNIDQSADVMFICKAIKAFIAKHNMYSRVIGVGVASPGILDTERGVVNYAVNLGWNNVPLVETMNNFLNVETYLMSDTVAGALGEQYDTAAGLTNYMYICIGTGLGACLMQNGEIFNGVGGAINLGHMSVIHNGKLCKCGNKGCLEKYVSAIALTDQFKSGIREDATLLNRYSDILGKLETQHIFEKAKEGDAYALSMFQKAGQLLGIAIVNCIHLFEVQKFIIGGGVSQAGDYLLEPARQEVEERFGEGKANIIQSTTPTKSGASGAAFQVFQSEKKKSQKLYPRT